MVMYMVVITIICRHVSMPYRREHDSPAILSGFNQYVFVKLFAGALKTSSRHAQQEEEIV